MARRMKISESPVIDFEDDIYDATPEPTRRRQVRNAPSNGASLSPSPAASVSSDKENNSRPGTRDSSKGRSIPSLPGRRSHSSNADGARKRKRTNNPSTSAVAHHQRRLAEERPEEDTDDSDFDCYDPDQSLEERRKIRGRLRNIAKELIENRAEYLRPDSTGLLDTLNRANEVATSVKQPTDATIDSRILVTTADFAFKKAIHATSGESAQGVDVEEFIAKCIGFMRRGDGAVPDGSHRPPSSTQRRRRRRSVSNEPDDGSGDDGDMLNWEHLGRFACLQHNTRPSVPGFLLGPLSLEKRARKVVQRSQGLKHSNLKLTQPEVVSPEDVEKSENANLTVLCSRILSRLKKVQRDGQEAVEREYTEDMSELDVKALMDKYGVCEGGGVDYFRFVVNPDSFGQTVENMFYVSFLIRDGKAGITIFDDGLPVVEAKEPRERNLQSQDGVSKHQAVIALDMAAWIELVEVFNITEPMIPHREEEEESRSGARGWYS